MVKISKNLIKKNNKESLEIGSLLLCKKERNNNSMSEFIAKIRAELDSAEAEKQLKNLTEKEHELKLKTNVEIDNKSTQKGIDQTIEQSQKRTKKNPIQVDVDYKESKTSGLSQLVDRANRLFSLFSNANAIDWGADQIRDAIGELKEMDSILTEISKTSDSTASELKKLANESFDVASKYGRNVTDYLTAVQEMSRSGFYGKQGEAMAELSMLGQAAGDMTSDVSNSYLLATNAAYDYAGSVEKLNTVLDGQNMITNRNSVAMLDMAQATSKSASMASQTGVEVNELSAIIGTAVARTKQSGNIIGTSLKSLFVNLQDTSNEKIVDTFNALGVSQTKFVDGAEQLKTPIELLKELSVAYNNLPEGSTLKADVLRNIGQKRQANVLAAILGGISSGDYDKMLNDYSQGKGSAMVEAEKSAENLEGRLNSLSNSWTEFVSKFAQTDSLKGGISFLDGIVSSMTNLQDKQLFLPSMLSAIMGLQNVFTGKGISDIGISKGGTGSLGKLDIKGSLFGIDFTEMGNWKEHFSESEIELEKWNAQCLKGRTNVEKFESSFKDNNAGFKAYISTVNDGTANVKDYRQSLEDAGEYQKTFSSTAKSILANAATGLLVGTGIELSLAALTKVADELIFKQDQLQEKADSSASAYSSTVSEIESINSELATTQARIDELKAQDKLLPGDEAELTRLEQQNALLQTQLDMKERLAESQAKGAAEAAKESIDYSSEKSLDTRMDRNGMDVVQNIDRKEYVRQRIAEMKKAQKQIDDTQKELNNKYISDDKRDMYERQFEQATANLEKYRKEATEMLSELNSESENFYDKQTGQVLKGYEDDVKAITELNNALNNFDLSPIEQQMQSINSYFDGSTTSNIIKEQLLEAVQSGESATDALHAMGVTLNDLGITGEGKKAVFDDYFRGLIDSAEQAEEAVKSIDGTVDGVKSAFESENQDANWKSMADALKQAGDLYKESKIGTDDFQSAVQFIAPKKINPDDTKFDAQAYVKAYEKYKDKIKRYFDSEDEKKSAANLQNDLIDKGLAKQTDNGIDWTDKFKTSADAAKAWGISVEAAEVAMRSLETYGAEWDNVTFSTENLSRYQSSLEQIKGIYDSMDDNSEGKERLKNIIDQSEIDDFENNLDNLTEDKVINIEFEYDLAQLDAEIAELEKNVANSDGKDIKENAALLSRKQSRRDTAEKYLTEERGMKIPVEYEVADKAISELQNKLKQSGLSEDKKVEFQAEISNLTDLQNDLLNAFDSSNMSWSDFIKTDTFDKFVSDINDAKSKVEELSGESIDMKGDIDTSKIDDKIDGVLNNDGKTITMKIDASSDQIQAQLNQLQNGQKMVFNANVDGKQTGISATKDEKGKITYTAVIDNVEKILTQNGTVDYTIGSQEEPKDKSSNVNYTKGEQENPEDKNTIVNYDKGKQEKPDKQKTTVDYNKGKQQNPDPKNAGVNYKKSGQEAPSDKTANVYYKVAGSAVGGAISKAIKGATGAVKLNGTAHKEGTVKDNDIPSPNTKNGFLSKIGNGIRRAFASGTIEDDSFIKDKWRTKKSETALTGEEGQELVATRDNTWYTVGDNGAEFAHIPAGSVVFNAKQTEELLKKGSILSRGKALLSGTISRGKAFLNGTAFANGMPLIGSSSKKKSSKSSSKSDTRYNKKASKQKSKKASKDAKKAKETFDWIEVAINRIERSIDSLDLKASSVYRSWSSRNANLKSEISKVNKEISVQNKGYDRYIQQAKNVSKDAKKNAKKEGFTKSTWDSLTKKVREGKIDISTIKNEKLAERIKEYQQWYEKALDCRDAVDELNEKVKELYETAFNNVVSQYQSILSIFENKKNMLEEAISQSEEKGYITSIKYYEALMKNEQDNISKLQKEKTELLKSLNEAVNSGAITKESESWYEMCNQIDDVTLAIEEANTEMLKFSNSIRDIQWEIFDLLQDRISHITDESKFLTDLLSNDELYDDKGRLTNEGLTTMGLHGVNYNVYMAQADKYKREMDELNKQIANDPYDQNLIDRKQELLELQQDMILAAEDEKQAIRDMVEDGIEKELDSLKDLIDTYTEALDAQKDLYDYQKRVKEQTKEITNLQKMLDAYQGDNSEEAKAKIQEYKVSLEEAKSNLEETEYDRYVSDQKKMLDTLYDEYEEILNKRLDDIEALITDMIAKINENASSINATLSEKAESVGYEMTKSMETIWDGTNNILTTYGEYIVNGIESAATTVNSAINALDSSIRGMVSYLDVMANSKVQESTNSSTADGTNNNTSSGIFSSGISNSTIEPVKKDTWTQNVKLSGSGSSSSNSSKKSGGDGKAKVGDKVTYVSGSYYGNSSGGGGTGSKNKGKSVYITRIKSGAKKPYHISTGKKFGSGDLGWVNLSQLKGYAKGTTKVPHDQLAWTQENNKPEVIIRKSDGAVLTPLGEGDMVFNQKQIETFRAIMSGMPNNVTGNLGAENVKSAVQSISKINNTNNNNSNVTNEFHMTFELPNVTNYEEFKRRIQYDMVHDKNMVGAIQAMTVGEAAGGSTLRKYRFL